MRLVLDASAAVRIVMRAEDAAGLLAALIVADVVVAPSLFVAEVANAWWKYTRAGALTLETTLRRYEEAVVLVDDLTPDDELAIEALAEAARHGHPVYELIYAVLARRHGCSVLTRDQRLAGLLGVMSIPMAETPDLAVTDTPKPTGGKTPEEPRSAAFPSTDLLRPFQ